MEYMMFKFLLFLSILFVSNNSFAFMPSYDDDDEFRRCTRFTQNWDKCIAEQTQRVLNDVKREYRDILGNGAILKWNNSVDENTQTLRDMYESWTAFRNRLCSLSKAASTLIYPINDEELTCNLYYSLHHRAHLSNIIRLMNRDVPENRYDFKYLKIYDHDDDYNKCITEKKNVNICINEELTRSTKEIKDLYKSISKAELTSKWNNGPDIKKGNFRDLFDSWIAYRNRICSLSVNMYHNVYGQNAITTNECIQYFNREKLETLQNILIATHSSLEEEIDEEEIDNGEAAGKKIPPLVKKISSGSNTLQDRFFEESGEPNNENKTPEEPVKKEIKKNNKMNIPSWAKQN